MKQEYKDKIISTWWKEINKDKQGLMLTGDVDSLLSSIILQQRFGVKINSFYNFKDIYKVEDCIEVEKERIAVDADIVRNKGFGNHVTRLWENSPINPEIINLNAMFDCIYANSLSYHYKSGLSTLLTILGLYECDIDCFSEEAKMLLLAIDSSYLGYYSQYTNDNKSCKFFLCDVLGLNELYEVIKRHEQCEFARLKDQYTLNGQIYIDAEGYLKTNIKLDKISQVLGLNSANKIELPKDKFILEKSYKTGYGTREELIKLMLGGNRVISLAATSKFMSCYTFEL